jgi:hypothetical protein
MDRYIGLDAHSSSCTVGVIGPSGKRLQTQVLETNARVLIDFIRTIPVTRHLCLEEGTQSNWLYEVLSPHVQEMVVMGVRKNRGPKSDKIDAFGLAEKLRIGAVETRVYKKRGAFGTLGECCRAYNFLVADSVRVQNRIKSLFRSRKNRDFERYFRLPASISPLNPLSIPASFRAPRAPGTSEIPFRAFSASSYLSTATQTGSSQQTRTHLPHRFQAAGFPGQRRTA